MQCPDRSDSFWVNENGRKRYLPFEVFVSVAQLPVNRSVKMAPHLNPVVRFEDAGIDGHGGLHQQAAVRSGRHFPFREAVQSVIERDQSQHCQHSNNISRFLLRETTSRPYLHSKNILDKNGVKSLRNSILPPRMKSVNSSTTSLTTGR